MNLFRELTSCRACGGEDLHVVLDLGNCAISDFVLPGEKLDYVPLTLMMCQHCEMIQLRHAVNKDRLYRRYYYRSGLNESMSDALLDVVTKARRRVTIKRGDTVVDIGCNDGTLLSHWPSWLTRVGIDPSNVEHAPDTEGVIFHNEYFPPIGSTLEEWNPRAIVITAIAMFYDLEYPGEFLEAARQWLHPEGVLVIQMPDLYTMFLRNAFDNICHEHVTYWPTRALYKLAQMHGLELFDMENTRVNGGSIRYYFKRGIYYRRAFDENRTQFYKDEMPQFVQRVQHERANTLSMLRTLKQQGKDIWAYGASTKGNTLLQYYNLGPDIITAVADRNPDKVGRVMVTGIPIRSEEEFRGANPDFALMLPWAFADNFIQREQDWLRSGRFIIPLPNLRLVGGGTDNASIHAEASSSNTG